MNGRDDHGSRVANREGEIERRRGEMVELARAMLRGEVGILAGSRRMRIYQHGAGVEELDEDMIAFAGIDSQEDHLPIDQPARAHLHPEALARVDAEIAEAEDFHREAALAACASLVRRFGGG